MVTAGIVAIVAGLSFVAGCLYEFARRGGHHDTLAENTSLRDMLRDRTTMADVDASVSRHPVGRRRAS